ncbi:MAG: FimV/HubP family polar landmark protein [Sulfuricella sp.]
MDRKYKKTAWLTAGMMLMASLPAFAAGLGKLTVTSALGQPFRGEIDLLAVDKKDLSSIHARFASFEAFKEAKIERAPVLSAMRFSVEQKKNGDPYLKITSSKSVDEPFLDMLIELDWPAGRLVREYTILLDPPGYGEQQAETAPVVKPVSAVPAQAAAVSAQPADTPTGAVKPEIRANIPLDKKLPAKEKAKAEVAGESKPARETYGPVRKGEYLAGIASALKPEGVSLEQMLVALFQSNKQAFAGNNMNRLKAGQILRVPEAGQAEEVKTSEAAKQVKAHSADWHAYRQKLAAAVAEAKPAQEDAARQAVSGKITTAVEDRAAAAKASASDVLKLSKSEGLGEAKTAAAAVGAGKDMQAMKGHIQALQEEATAKEKAIKEANQRISDLEKNIKEMQKLLELKNQNLADLQKQAAATKTEPAVLPALAPAAPATAKPEEKPAVAAAVAEKAPVVDEKLAAMPKKPKPVLAEQKKPETSFLDEALENPLYLGSGAVAILLLGLLAAKAVVARRRKNVASFEDSIMTHGDLKANTILGGTSGGKIDTGDTSFLTDFSQAGLGSIDTNEVDPIAEAEVYMAYGRDAQAEEILKEALSKDPNRHEIRLKLLEIYAGRKNLNAFEAVAGEMYAALGGQASPVWDKAAEMGRTLDPQNPLYAEKSKAAVATEPVARADEDIFEKTMIVAGGAAGLVAATEHGVTLDLGGPEITQAAESDLDFNLDIVAPAPEVSPDVLLPEPAEESLPVGEAAADLGFDLDLGALTGAVAQAEQPAAAPVAGTEEPVADMGLDFNLDLAASTVVEAAPEPAAATMEPDESVMEFDLGALTQAAPSMPAEELISAESWKDEVMALDVGGLTTAPGTEDEMAEVGDKLDLPDFSVGEEAASAGEEMESIELAALPVEESALDFDFNLDQEETPAPAEAKGAAAPDLDLSGISLDMSEPGSAKLAPTNLPDDFGSQEVSTKLDLARAYVDMGDAEGARDILQEVLKEGAAEQQEEARKLLAELG